MLSSPHGSVFQKVVAGNRYQEAQAGASLVTKIRLANYVPSRLSRLV